MDNPERFQIRPVAEITGTHRFRDLADFQTSTVASPFMRHLRTTILTRDYDKIKKFKLNPRQGVQRNEDLLPPPGFARQAIPFRYAYQKNLASRTFVDADGEAKYLNVHKPPQIFSVTISMRDLNTPTSPSPDLPPVSSLHSVTRKIIEQGKVIFEERPICTRRAFKNQLNFRPQAFYVREAIQYLGYLFRGGPWRDTIIRWGVDPRSDPTYRKYQSLFFQLDEESLDENVQGWSQERSQMFRRDRYNKRGKKADDVSSHLFDGEHVLLDAKGWQLCDISDPLLKSLVDSEEIRPRVNDVDGWYPNGTIAKIKTIMREKILTILADQKPNDMDYASLLDYPEYITPDNVAHLLRGKNAPADPKIVRLGAMLRSLAGGRTSELGHRGHPDQVAGVDGTEHLDTGADDVTLGPPGCSPGTEAFDDLMMGDEDEDEEMIDELEMEDDVEGEANELDELDVGENTDVQ